MPSQPAPLVLGSASPRRRALLEQVGLTLEVRPVGADEAVRPGESPRAYVERVALDKLSAALTGGAGEAGSPFVLTADTSVVRGETILGKPDDDAHAVSMLAQLAGRTHRVMTAVALGRVGAGPLESIVVTTEVRFRDLAREELARYVATGEGRDKAGSYAIQGIGAGFVEGVVGSYTNVVGLPICETLRLLSRHGALTEWP